MYIEVEVIELKDHELFHSLMLYIKLCVFNDILFDIKYIKVLIFNINFLQSNFFLTREKK